MNDSVKGAFIMVKIKGFDYKKAEADLDDVGAHHPDEIF